MRTSTVANLSLMPVVVGALLKAGAQLFAVVVGTVTAAPPRSLAMYAGEYGYDSGPFSEVMPTVTLGTGVVLAASLAVRVPDATTTGDAA